MGGPPKGSPQTPSASRVGCHRFCRVFLALFREAPRSADAIAATDVELIVINNDRLDWLMQNRPQVAREMVRRLSEWVVRTDRERALSNR